MLRLEFNHSLLDYYTELDAVLLIGTSELILPKDKSHKRNLTDLLQSMNSTYPDKNDIYNLTPNYTNTKMDLVNLKATLPEHCIMYKRYYNHRYYAISNIFIYILHNNNKWYLHCYSENHESKLVSELEQFYHCVPPFEEGYNNMQQFLLEDFSKFVQDVHVSSNDLENLPCGSFSVLPVKYFKRFIFYY